MKPKPMKPVKAWALVWETSGSVRRILWNGESRRVAKLYAISGERIARVEIREVARAPKGH